MKRKIVYPLIFLVLCFSSIKADEGMWMLQELNSNSASRMKELGFTFPMDSIYNESNASLKDAVVIFGRGCTGVAVSQKGLIFTNHHCGYDDIQKLSALDHDYLKDGFHSQSFEEEIAAPGLTVSFLDRTEDMTDYILSAVKDIDDEMERIQLIDSLALEIEAQYQTDTFTKATLKSYYAGNKYYLVVYKVFKDVRLVLTPPSSVGSFGGETDNWMWPRHTGDFSVFRVYANQNNEPSAYAETNIPYTPKYSVPVSIKGYDKNDYAMTIGYPGSTDRYMTSWGINEMVESIHKPMIAVRGAKQEIWKAAMNADDATRIKYASKYAMSSNYWKNAMGKNESIKKLGIIEEKEVLEQEFTEWIKKDKNRNDKYTNTLNLLKSSYTKTLEPKNKLVYFGETFFNGIELGTLANIINYRIKNANGDETVKEKLKAIYKDYDASLDQKVMTTLLQLYRESVSKEYHPEFYTQIDDEFGGDYDLYSTWLFNNSKIVSYDKVLEVLNNKEDSIFLATDPAFAFAETLTSFFKKTGTDLDTLARDIYRGEREYMAELMEMNPNKTFYSDANFTQRLSYGSIGGYSPADAIAYDYYTTSKGVLDKIIENDPEFDLQDYIVSHLKSDSFGKYLDKDGTMHINFLSNNDITGGNSGSPVFNGQAQLIGLAFDGNWEALSGDIIFDNTLQKCINVDIRYVLYMIDKVQKCSRIIDELDIIE